MILIALNNYLSIKNIYYQLESKFIDLIDNKSIYILKNLIFIMISCKIGNNIY